MPLIAGMRLRTANLKRFCAFGSARERLGSGHSMPYLPRGERHLRPGLEVRFAPTKLTGPMVTAKPRQGRASKPQLSTKSPGSIDAIATTASRYRLANGRQSVRRRRDRVCGSGVFWLELIDDHQLQGFDRLEILWRYLGLRNREVEFGFDTKHQVDHVHRCQPDIHQMRFRTNFHGNRVLVEDRLDESKDTELNIGAKGFHLYFPLVVVASDDVGLIANL
jgi:hypothetical protein